MFRFYSNSREKKNFTRFYCRFHVPGFDNRLTKKFEMVKGADTKDVEGFSDKTALWHSTDQSQIENVHVFNFWRRKHDITQ